MSKLARIEPSRANDPSIYEDLQGSQQERILDDCPSLDTDIPPLPLLYRGFGEFQDIVNNPNAELPRSDLIDEVDKLVNAARHLGYEKENRLLSQGHLQQIFSWGPPPVQFSFAVGNGSQATTDGYLLAGHAGPLVIIEHKRQIAMAEPQLAAYFIRLAVKPDDHIFRGWRQPGLGLLIRGEVIRPSWQMSLTHVLCQERPYPSTGLSWLTSRFAFYPLHPPSRATTANSIEGPSMSLFRQLAFCCPALNGMQQP